MKKWTCNKNLRIIMMKTKAWNGSWGLAQAGTLLGLSKARRGLMGPRDPVDLNAPFAI